MMPNATPRINRERRIRQGEERDVPTTRPGWARRVVGESYRRTSLDRARREPVARIAALVTRSAIEIAAMIQNMDRGELVGQSRLEPVPAVDGKPVVGSSGAPFPESAMSPCVPSPLTLV